MYESYILIIILFFVEYLLKIDILNEYGNDLS